MARTHGCLEDASRYSAEHLAKHRPGSRAATFKCRSSSLMDEDLHHEKTCYANTSGSQLTSSETSDLQITKRIGSVDLREIHNLLSILSMSGLLHWLVSLLLRCPVLEHDPRMFIGVVEQLLVHFSSRHPLPVYSTRELRCHVRLRALSCPVLSSSN